MTGSYMIRDSKTGLFWNGSVSQSRFSEMGRTWKKLSGAEGQLGYYVRYMRRYRSQFLNISSWEIVEAEVKPKIIKQHCIDDFLKHSDLRAELEKISANFSSFMNVMREKGVEADISYLVMLKPTDGHYRCDRERIKEARAQIRGLGIKTRTFREYNGIFGFKDRQQALRARLSLDIQAVADVEEIRNRLKNPEK